MRIGSDTRIPQVLDWAVADRALGERGPSGDRHVVLPAPPGAIVAVVDGLGHGADAARAAELAVATIREVGDLPVVEMVERCHERLVGTRGVAMTLVSVSALDGTLSWLGIGNVEAVLIRAGGPSGRESIPLRGGVVGYRLPRLLPSTVPVTEGDTLVLATDGIRHGFAQELDPHDPPQRAADRIVARFARDTDDALVLVARYLGTGS